LKSRQQNKVSSAACFEMLLLGMFMHQLQRANSAANGVLHDKLQRFYQGFLTSKLLYDYRVDMSMCFVSMSTAQLSPNRLQQNFQLLHNFCMEFHTKF